MCCNIDNSICEEIKNKCYHLDKKSDYLTKRNDFPCTKTLNNNNTNLHNLPIKNKSRFNDIQRHSYCSLDYSHIKRSDGNKIYLLDQKESKNTVTLKKNNASLIFTRKKIIQSLPDHHNQPHILQQPIHKYRSLHVINFNNKQKIEQRKQQAHSWYGPFEENSQQNLTENLTSNKYNLVGTKELNESNLLLHSHKENQNIRGLQPPAPSTAELHQFRIRKTEYDNDYQLSLINLNTTIECSQSTTMSSLSLGGPTPRRRRFEQFIKTLVGHKSSKDTNIIPANQAQQQPYSQQHLKLESLYTPFTQNHSVQASAFQLSNSPSIKGNIISQSLSSSLSLTSTTVESLSPPLSPPHLPIMTASTICITDVPSEMNLMNTNEHSISANSLNTYAHQKIRNVVPLLRRNNCSCSNLYLNAKGTSKTFTNPSPSKTTMSQMAATELFMPTKAALSHTKSCYSVLGASSKSDTVMTSTQSAINLNHQPVRAQNRLRNNTSITTCSRCSSLLSIVAVNSSRYSLHVANGGFVKVDSCKSDFDYDNEYTIEAINNAEKLSTEEITSICHEFRSASPVILETSKEFICKLCLLGVPMPRATKISQCGCSFCHECMTAYIDYEIFAGAFEISCPDALCPRQGILTIEEIQFLTPTLSFNKHIRYRLNREIELDKRRTWCPKAGCETVCIIVPRIVTDTALTSQSRNLLQSSCLVKCPTCLEEFCSGCKNSWHPSLTCEENKKQLVANGKEANIGMPFNTDLIKCCPMCSVPIEKDEGCAQMMCKRCKHVFCWYCLASLDDDFLLRHYDKGPCKNKLGHSRASVVWHRAQVIGIFAGFGILLLIASPLLLLAAPCIVCCKCRICSGTTRLEENVELEEVVALQR